MIRATQILVLMACLTTAANASIINGDFETGDLTGWTTFTTVNGTIGGQFGFPDVVLFDTNGDSVSTFGARFQVGQATGSSAQEGGGVFQNFTSASGQLDITVDIASYDSTPGNNASAGIFSLLLDGVVVDSYDFGNSIGNGIERNTLSSSSLVGAGSHEIRILMTRRYTIGTTAGTTPYQFIDNVVLSGDSLGGNSPVPEPATIAVWSIFGLCGVGYGVRRKLKNAAQR